MLNVVTFIAGYLACLATIGLSGWILFRQMQAFRSRDDARWAEEKRFLESQLASRDAELSRRATAIERLATHSVLSSPRASSPDTFDQIVERQSAPSPVSAPAPSVEAPKPVGRSYQLIGGEHWGGTDLDDELRHYSGGSNGTKNGNIPS